MGAGASSLPERVDKAEAEKFAGDRFDGPSFDKLARSGTVSREELLKAASDASQQIAPPRVVGHTSSRPGDGTDSISTDATSITPKLVQNVHQPTLAQTSSQTGPAQAANPDSGSLMETAIISALSAARTDPAAVRQNLLQRLEHFKGNSYYPQERDGKVAIETKEGRAAVDEAVAFLSKKQPMLGLSVDSSSEDPAVRGMRCAAQDHAVDRGCLGEVGHEGADEIRR